MKRRFSKSIFFAAVLVVVFFATTLITENSFAVPPFARKYKTSCQMCHSVPGVLNGFGREFKRNGYVMPGNEPTEGGDLMSEQIEELPGFGGLMEVEGKFYPKREDKSQKKFVTDMTMPEIEFFMAGNTGNVGYMVVFLASLAGDDPKKIEVEAAQAQFNDVGMKGLNVRVGHMLGGPQHIDGFYIFKGVGTVSAAKFSGDGELMKTQAGPGTGVEVNAQFGPVYFGVGMTAGLGKDSEEKNNNDFHKAFFAFLEFKYGSSGSGFWAGDMITARLHFAMDTTNENDDSTAPTKGFPKWKKGTKFGAAVDFWYGPLISTILFDMTTQKEDGSGVATANRLKDTELHISLHLDAILMNGKINPGLRFEYDKKTRKNDAGVDQYLKGTRTKPADMYLHIGFSSLLRSNIWAVAGARLNLSATKQDEYNNSTNATDYKKVNNFLDVFEAKVVVSY